MRSIYLIPLAAVALLVSGCVSTEAAFERGQLAAFSEAQTKAVANRMDERHRLVVSQLAAERQARIDAANQAAIAQIIADGGDWQDGWDLRGEYERKTEENRQAVVEAITDSAQDKAVLYELAPVPTIITGMADREQEAVRRAARQLVGDAYRTALGVWNAYVESKRDPVPPGVEGDEDPVSDGAGYTQEQIDYFADHGYPG